MAGRSQDELPHLPEPRSAAALTGARPVPPGRPARRHVPIAVALAMLVAASGFAWAPGSRSSPPKLVTTAQLAETFATSPAPAPAGYAIAPLPARGDGNGGAPADREHVARALGLAPADGTVLAAPADASCGVQGRALGLCPSPADEETR